MKFKLIQRHEVEWPVSIRVPQDGGRTQVQIFNARFELVDQDAFDELSGRAALLRREAVDPATMGDRPLLRRVFVGWSGVTDEADADVPFSEDVREMLISREYVRNALVAAYGEASAGGRAKN